MSIRFKLIAIYIFSIITSVVVFMLSTYYLLNIGYYSGITKKDMKNVAQKIANENTLDSIAATLTYYKERYPKMEFELFISNEEYYATTSKPFVTTYMELVDSLEGDNEYSKEHVVIAKSLEVESGQGEQEQAYLLVSVYKEVFATVTYSFWGRRANGILGKITLFGLVITLCVLSIFIFLFMKKIAKRIRNIYIGIEAFELGNAGVRIQDEQKDEIGDLACSFDTMAEKIEEQLTEKEQYEESRKQLVSNLSHDLRTPLSSILGYSEMLKDGLCTEEGEQKRYMNTIHRKAGYMNQLLGELLEFSRLDIGSMELHKERCNLSELLRELIIEYLPVIEVRGIALEVEIPEQAVFGELDKERMERSIRNVIDNALKYGMQGKKLRIALTKEDTFVRIEVQDYGQVLSEETRKHVFERFYRGDTARNSKAGGMGLGLAITEEIIQKHGGSIWIESEVNKGTCIVIILHI